MFVQNLVIDKRLTDCNANVISMKADLFIKMTDLENYNEINLYMHQKFVEKLIYLLCGTRPDIVFAIGQHTTLIQGKNNFKQQSE